MKDKTFSLFLAAEAIFCLLFYSAQKSMTGIFSSALAFPFEQTGMLLRYLSLSGTPGNALALILYLLLCMIPAFLLLHLRVKEKAYPEDSLLGVLTIVLFVTLYLMINPGEISSTLGGAAALAGKALLGAITYSILLGYFVLRLLRRFFLADISKIQCYLEVLIRILIVLFVFIAFGSRFGILLDAYKELHTGNAGNEEALTATCAFLTLQYLVDILPFLLDILVSAAALRLLRELKNDRYTPESAEAAKHLSRCCGLSLSATVLSNIIFHLLELIFAKSLLVISGTVQLPLMSVTFLLVLLLSAQYIRENQRLKKENDLFI